MIQKRTNSFIVPILTLGVFGIINTEMGVVGMIPTIAETFGVSVPEAGWTVTIFAIIIALCGPVTPMLFSRFNRKAVMVLALGVFVATTAASAFVENFSALLVLRAIPAFLHPVYVSMAFTVAAASVPKNEGPKAVARIFIGVSAGMVLGVPAASFIASEFSYSAAMAFFSAVNALVLLLTLIFVPSLPVKNALTYGEQLRVLKRPSLWIAVAAVVFTNGTTFGFFSYLADFLKTVTGLDYAMVSVVLFIYGATNILGNMLAGKLLAQSPLPTIRWTPAALALSLGLLWLFGGNSFGMTAAVAVFGILTGLSSNNSQYLISDASRDAPEFGNGLFLSCANSGTAAGTAFCGLFIDRFGTEAAIAGALLFLAAAGAAVLAATARGRCAREHNAASCEHQGAAAS